MSEWPNVWWLPGGEDEPDILPEDEWTDIDESELPF